MQIEKRPFADIPDTTHAVVREWIAEHAQIENSVDKDALTAQYFDMMFRAGWHSAKNHFRKDD